MKVGWKVKPLGEVSNLTYGFTEKASFSEIGPKFVRITDIQGNHVDWDTVPYCKIDKIELPKYALSNGDIVFARTGATTGKSYMVVNPPNAVYASYLIKLHITESLQLSPEFLYLYFQTKTYWDHIAAGISGSAQGGFNATKLAEINIPIPPLLEQHRIVTILDEVFDSISRAKDIAEQNLINARELFESYLPMAFTNSGAGFEKVKLKEIAKVIGGYSFKSTDFKKSGQYQVLRMGNVRPGLIREDESPVYLDEIDEKIHARARLLPNDVIITQTGTNKKRDYGFTAIIERDNYLLNQRMSAIRFSKLYLPEFFLYYSWTDPFKDQYFANETGTVGQGNVGINAINDALVPFPSIKEQKEVVLRIGTLLSEVNKLESIYQHKLTDLEELKKSVLQKAFNGELITD